MFNPYENVDWKKARRITSTTHIHLSSQEQLDNAYKHGVRHFAISNYYPSAPTGPDSRPSDYRLRQDWPVQRHGKPMKLPVNWNDVIDWQEELADEARDQLPFKETDPMFSRIPPDTAWSPNAEHHGFTDTGAHITCPGSFFRSGTFDARNRFGTFDHGFVCGYGGPWRDAFREMCDQLAYPDGGGVIINHPTWFSRFSNELVFEMLDFDPRVLGIEIYNDYSATREWEEVVFPAGREEPEKAFSLAMWDRILRTGRRVWGFCVPDHSAKTSNWPGRCTLLVDEFSDRACLKAYRDGAFIGCLSGEGVQVESLAVTEDEITINLDAAATIRFITQDGCVLSSEGTHARYPLASAGSRNRGMVAASLSPSACIAPAARHSAPTQDIYVRIEVSHESGERLFLQPILQEQLL